MAWLALLWVGAWAHPLDGEWELITSTGEAEQVLTGQIQKALRSWPGFAVAMATERIVEENGPCPRYRFVAAPEAITLQCLSMPAYTRPVEGVHRFQDPKGRDVSSRVTVDEEGFKITFTGDDGARTDDFAVSGDELVLQAKVSAQALPKAIRWTWRYRRADGATSPSEEAAASPSGN